MEWDKEAEAAISKVPFFVRKRVRKRVEESAVEAGMNRVTLAHVETTRQNILDKQEREVRGYQLSACFGQSGCPNRIGESEGLLNDLEALLERHQIKRFLEKKVAGKLKFHHEFRVTLADCPNCCSQPQIRDIGIIAAREPQVIGEECTGCGACVAVCPDAAIEIEDIAEIDSARCMKCGICIPACPMDAMVKKAEGYRILLGGRLGRHPRLGIPLPDLYSKEDVLRITNRCLNFWKENTVKGERFAKFFDETMIPYILRF